jgi:hypothetical protein
MKIHFVSILTAALVCCIVYTPAAAQSNQHSDVAALQATILHRDSLFWHAYNTCNADSMTLFVVDDLEFYHDKGGPTLGLQKFGETTRTGLCGNTANWQLRREAVPGTVKFFPMYNSGMLYGAILQGEHVFYVHEAGKKEYLDGHARFSHLWLNKDGAWKMARVLSYDHKPAVYTAKTKIIPVPTAKLKRLNGTYNSSQAGTLTVKQEGNALKITTSNFQVIAFPETTTKFFLRNRDLQFEFVEENKHIARVIIYERGGKVEEAPRMQ